ncbi:MAG: hypothetical protein HOL66_04675 [Rhodospirillaceae bacterium]|jgi:hypothetical protein|nr:hypothetical protein [Rhodospirillaceae bacterium]MBT5243516.1 hypothetical protein [Rhodospirillaceae bacterium]MBT5562104.1 hypothetical protein [Rhodospirillaceae bacterium]MBT6242277.1 hypothetical protein [Rhodospirillaceae bacterium]MBT7136899.1 hypothetical protein [Rhodospirillaceae bacterium]
MIRVFLLYVLPIALPSLMYFCWAAYIHKFDEGEPDKAAIIRQGPWFRLVLAGLCLMAVGLVTAAITGGMSPDGQYQAPYAKDGEIVPGRMVPKQE